MNDQNAKVLAKVGALTVTVTNLDEDGDVTAEFKRSTESWDKCTLVFHGGGRVRVTIQDYYYCIPTSIEVVVRNYPEGARIRNFTYDGFHSDEGYHFDAMADHITNAKHGTYEYDFGYGPEVLDYSHKMDSKAEIKFTPEHDGKFIIAIASQNVGAGLKVNDKEVAKLVDAYTLYVVYLEVKKGTTYHITRNNKECGIYYLAYLPNSVAGGDHTHAYYTTTTATCTSDGVTTYKCLVCGTEKTENTEAFKHNIVSEAKYEATCTEQGKEAGSRCTRCEEETKGYATIQALGHTYSNNVCTRCNNVQSYNAVKKVDFTTGEASDYQDYGNGKFFEAVGNCDISNDHTYLIMKTVLNDEGVKLYHSYIEFTINTKYSFVVVASSTDRGNTSRFTLMDSNDNVVAEKFGETSVEGVSGETLVYNITQPGTYRFLCSETNRVGRLMSVILVSGTK